MIIPTGKDRIMDEFWFPLTSREVNNIAPIFQISTWGRILNTETKNILPQNENYSKNHYITVRLKDANNNIIMCQPHRIVMLAFFYIENAYLFEVNHKDGVKYHNWIWNLEWTTHDENMKHAVSSELLRYGETHQNSKLTNEQAEDICILISKGYLPVEIENIVQINDCNIQKIVQNIKLGYSWRKLSSKYGIT